MSNLSAAITRSWIPSGTGYVYSTPIGELSVTTRMGVGWSVSQLSRSTNITTWIGQFATLDEVEAHIEGLCAR
jgi:hypothetical protein